MEHAYRRGRQNMRKNNGMQEAAAAMRGMSVPNSAITSLFGDMGMGGSADIDAAMQTRITMLNRQRPAAEREADRLSAGVRARTPEQLKSEMGARLGADFSSVRFHSDSSSVRRGDDIGARAWTQGNDVYFGEGGFDPAVAAHELVHTVQQGSVSGQVGVSAPAGEIQMMPNPLKWIKNKFGERKRRKEQEKAELKLSRNAKKPWEMSKKDFKDNHFNPGDVDEISDIQKEIDGAQTANEAYKAFLKYTGDDSGGMKKKVTDENGNVVQYEAWIPEGLDLNALKEN